MRRDHDITVGALIALKVAIKLTPAFLVIWLLSSRRWRAVGATALTGCLILITSLIFAGPQSWLDWLGAVPQSAPSPMAISTVTGLPTWLIAVFAVVAVAIVGAATRGDRPTLVAAVIAAALATPALNLQAFALLLAVFVRKERDGVPGTGLPGRLRSYLIL